MEPKNQIYSDGQKYNSIMNKPTQNNHINSHKREVFIVQKVSLSKSLN